jgi:hypothetical protein
MNPESLYTLEAHNNGAWMKVKDKARKDTGCKLLVAGVDSDVFRDAKREASRLAIVASSKGERFDAQKYIATECVIDWEGFDIDGDELEFSKERVSNLLTNAPYLIDDVDRFLSDIGNFTLNSAKS